uniref:Polysaccharide deacetylase family protein n=1 Tax=candidate division CPR3 bacterium TaxID=2268181 RepID=A0A7C4R4Z6_UNCC3
MKKKRFAVFFILLGAFLALLFFQEKMISGNEKQEKIQIVKVEEVGGLEEEGDKKELEEIRLKTFLSFEDKLKAFGYENEEDFLKEEKDKEKNEKNGDGNFDKKEENKIPEVKPEIKKEIPSLYIALTFDDGPFGGTTTRVLDSLKKESVKATFFVVGSMVKANPAIAKRIVNEGHEIGNHSWSHPFMARCNSGTIFAQLQKTQSVIRDITGANPVVFRPPYGSVNNNVTKIARDKFGLSTIIWDLDTRDWRSPGSSVVTSRVLKGAKNGLIVLMHDSKKGTTQAVPDIIRGLKEKGYTMVTVSELLEIKKQNNLTKNSKVKK